MIEAEGTMPIRTRLVIWMATLVVVTTGVLLAVMLDGLSVTIQRAEQRELQGYLEAVVATSSQRTNTALALAELVASLPEVGSALAAGERQRLDATFSAAYTVLNRDAAVDQFQFHLPPATSFLRLHKPDLFGDDLSAFRLMVVAANRDGRSLQGLERGVAGLGERAVVPIDFGGRNVGSVEFGMDFGQSFVERFKARFGVDVAVHTLEDGHFRNLAATAAPFSDGAALRAALDGAPAIHHGKRGHRPVAWTVAPIADYSGKPVAFIEIAMDAGDYGRQYAQARRRALIIGGLVLAAGLAMAWLIARTISQPLTTMTEAMHRLAAGEVDVPIPASERSDEIGRMAHAMFVFKRNRAEIERQKEERDQFSRLGLLGEMASTIAHELNQPLGSILNYGRGMVRMLDGGDADPALLRTGAVGVAEQAERAAAILQRVRSFVRRKTSHRARIDLARLVRETAGQFESSAGRCTIAVETAPGRLTVMGERLELQQVLINLLQNAIDAMPEGGRIVVRTGLGEDGIEVAVVDRGSGLGEEAAGRLFDPFFTTKPGGLGLGLSICRTIVESHGGRLWAAANPQGGVTMTFALPPARPREG